MCGLTGTFRRDVPEPPLSLAEWVGVGPCWGATGIRPKAATDCPESMFRPICKLESHAIVVLGPITISVFQRKRT